MNNPYFLFLKKFLHKKMVFGAALFIISSTQVFALPDCPKLISLFLNKIIRSTDETPSFPQWDLKSMPKLRPQHFLPSKFIEEVESKMGSLYLKVEKKADRQDDLLKSFINRDYSSWVMNIGVKYSDPFITFTFIVDQRDSQSIFITGVEFINPLPNLKNNRTHLSQANKGLPFNVFQHLIRQVILFLKAGGYNKIKASPQTYLVSKLYRKMLGFRPINEKSNQTYLELDELYKMSKPTLETIKNYTPLDAFSRALGDHRLNNFQRPYAEVIELERSLKENPLTFFENKKEIYSPDGQKVIGFMIHSTQGSRVYYFIPNLRTLHILNWQDLLREYSLGLVLDL